MNSESWSPFPPFVSRPSCGNMRLGCNAPGSRGNRAGKHGSQIMDALDLLLTRESALKLDAPAPSQSDLDKMFQSAVRAPDHGRLRPWRFVVIESDKRSRLGDLMADSMRRRMPAASDGRVDRERAK